MIEIPPMKTCMACGEKVPWLEDCSHGHFRRAGIGMRYKAEKNTRKKP